MGGEGMEMVCVNRQPLWEVWRSREQINGAVAGRKIWGQGKGFYKRRNTRACLFAQRYDQVERMICICRREGVDNCGSQGLESMCGKWIQSPRGRSLIGGRILHCTKEVNRECRQRWGRLVVGRWWNFHLTASTFLLKYSARSSVENENRGNMGGLRSGGGVRYCSWRMRAGESERVGEREWQWL